MEWSAHTEQIEWSRKSFSAAVLGSATQFRDLQYLVQSSESHSQSAGNTTFLRWWQDIRQDNCCTNFLILRNMWCAVRGLLHDRRGGRERGRERDCRALSREQRREVGREREERQIDRNCQYSLTPHSPPHTMTHWLSVFTLAIVKLMMILILINCSK